MTGAATGEAETDSSTHTFTVNLTKGESKRLNFSVVGKTCSICDGEVASDAATDSVEIDVYELSISRPDYLGLDRTDAGRQGHVVKTATLSSDPSLPSSSSVEWTECGICEFVGAKNQWSVSYQNKDSETASGEYLAERLAASVKLAGMDSAFVCSTNFTVVAVDVTIGGVGEDKEEAEGAFVQYVPDAADGAITVEGTNKMSDVTFSCEPTDLPTSEVVTITSSGPGELYEELSSGELALITAASYPACELAGHKFKLHGHGASSALRDGVVRIGHAASGAKDVAKYISVSVQFITPAGDPVNSPVDLGEGQNEFTFSSGNPGELVMNLKARVSPAGAAAVICTDLAFAVDAVGSSAMAWDATTPNGRPAVSGGDLTAKVTFTGMPHNNADFGRKTAKLLWRGNPCAENAYEVFFDKSATNHPDGQAGSPNWYHYWAGEAVPGYELSSGRYSFACGNLNDYAVYNGDPRNPHYTIHGPASAGAEKYSSAGLVVDRRGIDTCAATIRHEKQHRQTDLDWLPGGTWYMKLDTDGDELPDDWEDSHAGFNKHNAYSFSPPFVYGDDEEVWCEMNALNERGCYDKDWANPGKQSHNPY